MIDIVIKASGKPQDVVTQLKILESIYGKGCPLSYIATMERYKKLTQAIEKQFNNEV